MEEFGVTRVEQFDLIRREHFLHGKSIRQIAKQYQIHRRSVKQALISAIPPIRKAFSNKEKKLTPEIRFLIDQWLQMDTHAPVKQRHTARRIHARLIEEYGFTGAEPTIRKYVGNKRKELLLPKEVFIIQQHIYGEEAEVDWYEVQVDFPEGRRKVNIFEMRACASGKEFHISFLSQDQQAFFEGHVEAFKYYGGIFKKIRYDNLGSAISKVLKGRNRKENEKFIVLRSHYLFEAVFCMPGIKGAHEKGGVEGGAGRFRRNYLVPVPKANDIKAFNDFLIKCCQLNDERRISGESKKIKEKWEEERQHLLSLPKEPLNTQVTLFLKVNDKSLINFKNNYYSMPVKMAGKQIEARIGSQTIDCFLEGRNVASHIRLYGDHEISMKLDHYLDLLKYKPGAFKGSLVLAKTKKKKEWPKVYEDLWKALISSLGESKGTQMLINILLLHREYGEKAVLSAVEAALQYGSYDVNAVLVLLRQQRIIKATPLLDNLGFLKKYDRPCQSLEAYNQLLH